MPKPKTIAIVQSSYIPWRGYFDLIRAADYFILLDDVQFTKRDWRSRNSIKTENGPSWLSVPVLSKGRRFQRILDTHVADNKWAGHHWESIRHTYGKAPYFAAYSQPLHDAYRKAATLSRLSDVNVQLLRCLCLALGIETPMVFSHELLSLEELDQMDSSTRLARLAAAVGGAVYLSGPSARAYLDPDPFSARGIDVRFVDYSRYPAYPQCNGPFEPAVSVMDLLFNVGARAHEYLLDFNARSASLDRKS